MPWRWCGARMACEACHTNNAITRWLVGVHAAQLDFGPRLAPKPLEMRPLWKPSSSNPQGMVECWVDILTSNECAQFPPLDISPPPPEKCVALCCGTGGCSLPLCGSRGVERGLVGWCTRVYPRFEMRLIVWKTRDVVSMDTVTNQNDLFVRCWMEEDDKDKQQTDCHYRCKNGKGSFNWRMKFNMELPQKFPYLHIQMWDRDIFSYNDCIAEAVLDMSAAFKRAFKLKKGFIMFQGEHAANAEHEAAAARAAKRGGGGTTRDDDMLDAGVGETKVRGDADLRGGGGGQRAGGTLVLTLLSYVWCVPVTQGGLEGKPSAPSGGDAMDDDDGFGTYEPPRFPIAADIIDDGESEHKPLLAGSINSGPASVRDRRGAWWPARMCGGDAARRPYLTSASPYVNCSPPLSLLVFCATCSRRQAQGG